MIYQNFQKIPHKDIIVLKKIFILIDLLLKNKFIYF